MISQRHLPRRDPGLTSQNFPAVSPASPAATPPGRSPAPVLSGRFTCIGCKRNRIRSDSEHNRIPGQCKFPHDVTIEWNCPGCRERAAVTSNRHTFVPGECRVPETRLRGVPSSSSGTRSEIRGAVPPAHREPTASMRPGAPAPDAIEETMETPEPRISPTPRRPPAWTQPIPAPRAPAGARPPTRNAAVEPEAAAGDADEDVPDGAREAAVVPPPPEPYTDPSGAVVPARG